MPSCQGSCSSSLWEQQRCRAASGRNRKNSRLATSSPQPRPRQTFARAAKNRSISASSLFQPVETRIALTQRFRDPHRSKHMRALDFARRAGRTRTHGYAFEIESDQKHLRPLAGYRKAGSIRQPVRAPPKITASRAMARNPCSNLNCKASARAFQITCALSAAFRAAARPAMPATFSVPERRRLSWPPPRINGAGSGSALCQITAPTPFGPPNL